MFFVNAMDRRLCSLSYTVELISTFLRKLFSGVGANGILSEMQRKKFFCQPQKMKRKMRNLFFVIF